MKYILILFYTFYFISCSYTNSFVDEERSMNYYQQGLNAFNERNLEKAQAFFELAYENGMHAEALDALGCIALIENSVIEAKELFSKSISVNTKFALPYGHLAFVYEKLNNYEKAKKLYLKALTIDPNNYRFRNNLSALIYDTYKEQEAKNALILAKAELKKALILENDNKQILNNMNILEGLNHE